MHLSIKFRPSRPERTFLASGGLEEERIVAGSVVPAVIDGWQVIVRVLSHLNGLPTEVAIALRSHSPLLRDGIRSARVFVHCNQIVTLASDNSIGVIAPSINPMHER